MKKSKKRPKFKVESFGRYTEWERGNKKLPKILEFTDTIFSEEGNEFGMILHITGGKGAKIDYCIKHPPFKDKYGNTELDFRGEYYINSNDNIFFIGDCIWTPVEDKVGEWIVSVEYEGKLIEEKRFNVVLPDIK